jgi:hypothetical protein
MNTYTIEKKRAGQDWKFAGDVYAKDFDAAKKKFAQNCWNDLLNGVHGDNFVEWDNEFIEELKKEEPNDERIEQFDVEGIYYNGELFMPKSDVEEGIECFSEDVFSWRLLDETGDE